MTAKSSEPVQVVNLPVSGIVANPFQPRKVIDDEKLSGLVDSIKAFGVLQPIQVTPSGNHHVVVVGHRRLEAAKKLGLSEIPCIVVELTDQKLLEHSLVENLQREDLNPVEEAESIFRLKDEFHMDIDAIGEQIGKSKTYVYDRLKINDMTESMQKAIQSGKLSIRKATEMMKLAKEKQREKLLAKAFGYSEDKLGKIIENKLHRKPREAKGTKVEFTPPSALKGLADSAPKVIKLGKEKVTFAYKSKDELIPLLEQVIEALKNENV